MELVVAHSDAILVGRADLRGEDVDVGAEELVQLLAVVGELVIDPGCLSLLLAPAGQLAPRCQVVRLALNVVLKLLGIRLLGVYLRLHIATGLTSPHRRILAIIGGHQRVLHVRNLTAEVVKDGHPAHAVELGEQLPMQLVLVELISLQISY